MYGQRSTRLEVVVESCDISVTAGQLEGIEGFDLVSNLPKYRYAIKKIYREF